MAIHEADIAVTHANITIPKDLTVGELYELTTGFDLDTLLTVTVQDPTYIWLKSLQFGVDRNMRTIVGPLAEIQPTFSEFNLIENFALHPNRLQTRVHLTNLFWGGVPSKALDVQTSNVRHRLDDIGVDRKCIETFRGVGYMLRVLAEDDDPKPKS